jgi:glycosyltransferase involved in cell wall biosynthesis
MRRTRRKGFRRRRENNPVVDETREALVAAMKTLADDAELRIRCGAAGRRAARENFSMDGAGDALLAVYRQGCPGVSE